MSSHRALALARNAFVVGIALALAAVAIREAVPRGGSGMSASLPHPVALSPSTAPTADDVPGTTLIATLKGPTPSYRRPDPLTFTKTRSQTWLGGVSALPVVDELPGWLHVRVPERPNGSTTWIRREAARLSSSNAALLLSVSQQRLTMFRSGRAVARLPAGVGRFRTPTPTGTYFVAVLKQSPDPGYGPFTMVTSAHSTRIGNWRGSGDALVSIHGPIDTDEQIGDTGAAVSNGCIRLHLKDLERLRDIPVGSPLIVTR